MPPALILIALIIVIVSLTAKAAAAAPSAAVQAFAHAISVAEGYGVPGAIPTVRNNPGDLKWGTDDITTFPTADAGWSALYEDILKMLAGGFGYSPDDTLASVGSKYTATEPDIWTANVVADLNAQGYSTLRELLT
jgi:hypothetical protein